MTTLRTATLTLALAALTTTSALAGPPLVTDDAGTVDAGKVEVELNGSYARDKERAAGITYRSSSTDAEAKISTGLRKNLGVSLTLPYTFSLREKEDRALVNTSEGFGDLTLEIKYAFAELAGITFAVKPTLIIPTGNYGAGLSEGRWQPGAALIASREFSQGNYAIHANLAYEHHEYRTAALRSTTHNDLWSGSIAGEMKLVENLVGVLDLGLASNPAKDSSTPPIYALTGARYSLDERFDLNAGIKVGLTRPEDDLALLYGMTIKF